MYEIEIEKSHICRIVDVCKPVWHGVSKGVEDCRRPPALQAGYPRTGHKAVLGVARPQGIEGSGMVGLGGTLGSL
jgi:hypothetical protein